jgi:hypothetical protein
MAMVMTVMVMVPAVPAVVVAMVAVVAPMHLRRYQPGVILDRGSGAGMAQR